MGAQRVLSSTRPPPTTSGLCQEQSCPGEYLHLVHRHEWGEIVKPLEAFTFLTFSELRHLAVLLRMYVFGRQTPKLFLYASRKDFWLILLLSTLEINTESATRKADSCRDLLVIFYCHQEVSLFPFSTSSHSRWVPPTFPTSVGQCCPIFSTLLTATGQDMKEMMSYLWWRSEMNSNGLTWLPISKAPSS